ncbi:MAG: hypothetical protein BA870_08200 [Desulfuromonadales bacterium C00003094]|jgi:hypothetical protein|nr:MAG: hypothetical protein BA870_08200 [Desulfuromonadales bacterium C00003094]
MFGGIFKQITGRSAAECQSLAEINQAVENSNGTSLKIKPYESGAVHKRGNVFNYTNNVRNLNSEMDNALNIRS